MKIDLYLPAGAKAVGGTSVELPLNYNYGCEASCEFTINTDEFTGGRLEGVIVVSLIGRHSNGAMRFTLVRDRIQDTKADDAGK